MGATDTDLFKDKIEVSLDGRQIFYLFFSGAVIATLVFVLGVMVGRRVEARAVVETGSPVTDPLAALDQLEGRAGLAFPTALRGDEQVMLGAVDENLARRKDALKPAVGGPLAAKTAAEAPANPQDESAPEKAPAAPEEPAAKPKAAEPEPAAKAAKAEPAAKAEDEASTPAAEPKPASRRRFTLQVGSFQDKEEADLFFRGLAGTSYEPYMVEADVPDKGTYYRVRIGGYGSFEEAVEAKSEFEASQHVIAYVTRLK